MAQADVLKFGHDLAAGRTRVELQPDLPELLTALRTLLPQGLQPRHAGHAAGTPRLHAFSDPHLFLRQQFVGAGVGQGLGIQFPLACLFKGRVRTGVAAQHAAVELDDAAGHGVDEGAVVGDEDQRATPILQQVLQPLDGVQVEVVGGLVEQEHIGLGHQGLCQGHPLAGTAGQPGHRGIGLEVQALQGFLHAGFPGPSVQSLDAMVQLIQGVVEVGLRKRRALA